MLACPFSVLFRISGRISLAPRKVGLFCIPAALLAMANLVETRFSLIVNRFSLRKQGLPLIKKVLSSNLNSAIMSARARRIVAEFVMRLLSEAERFGGSGKEKLDTIT